MTATWTLSHVLMLLLLLLLLLCMYNITKITVDIRAFPQPISWWRHWLIQNRWSCCIMLMQVLELDLQGNNFSRIGSRAFEGVKTLVSLNLAWSNISRVSTKAFRNLRLLRNLTLAENRLRRLNSFVFRDLRSLELLVLAGNKLTRVEPDLFRYQSNLQVRCRPDLHQPIYSNGPCYV